MKKEQSLHFDSCCITKKLVFIQKTIWVVLEFLFSAAAAVSDIRCTLNVIWKCGWKSLAPTSTRNERNFFVCMKKKKCSWQRCGLACGWSDGAASSGPIPLGYCQHITRNMLYFGSAVKIWWKIRIENSQYHSHVEKKNSTMKSSTVDALK